MTSSEEEECLTITNSISFTRKLPVAYFMGMSSLNTHWCAPPIINHLYFQKEILHITLNLSTPFLEMGQECQNAPGELELQFQNSIPLVSFRMDPLGDLTYGRRHKRTEWGLPDKASQGSSK